MKVARALVSFVDGSYLFVELARKIEPGDSVMFCEKIVGLPEGTPQDKPTIAVALMRLASSSESVEVLVPMARVNGITVQEEFLAKQVAKDIQDMWQPAPQNNRPGGRK